MNVFFKDVYGCETNKFIEGLPPNILFFYSTCKQERRESGNGDCYASGNIVWQCLFFCYVPLDFHLAAEYEFLVLTSPLPAVKPRSSKSKVKC